jgi:hypothetical protein
MHHDVELIEGRLDRDLRERLRFARPRRPL